MKPSWSKPVTQTELFGEPRNLVGVNADKVGSYDPISSVESLISISPNEFGSWTHKAYIHR